MARWLKLSLLGLIAVATAFSEEGTSGRFKVRTALRASDGALVVKDREAFERLARRDDVPGAFGALQLKFFIQGVDTPTPRLYFMNTKTYSKHYPFAQSVLGYSAGFPAFRGETYFNDAARRNLAGSLVAYDHVEHADRAAGRGVYTLEFWPSDPVGGAFVGTAYGLVQEAMPFAAGRLRYHPSGETQQALFEEGRAAYAAAGVSVLQTDELFKNSTYIPLNLGEAYGRLRRASAGERGSVTDIVVFQSIPNDLSHVAGIISEVPQTPLSHVNLKAKQNGTPNAYIRDASTRADIAPFLGKNIRLEITADGYSIRSATREEVDAFFESTRPAETQVPIRDLTWTSIAPLAELGHSDAPAFGSKSANVAELLDVLPEGMVPEGYAIPFSFYDEFMRVNGFYDLAEKMCSDEVFKTNAVARARRLKRFRKQIRNGQIPPAMESAFDEVQSSFPAAMNIRCRSSSNVEDLEGFNGAGLYDSKTHKPSEGRLGHTIKQVWAGNWTLRAFEERAFYRIDHQASAMGVLCHRSFSDERANGVAVTKDLFNAGFTGYYVNAQVDESMVTNPEQGAVPDEFLISALKGLSKYEIQYVRHSNRVPTGTTVLSRSQAVRLARELKRVQTRFRAAYGAAENPAFAMEVEFKITAEGALIIKQARPWID